MECAHHKLAGSVLYASACLRLQTGSVLVTRDALRLACSITARTEMHAAPPHWRRILQTCGRSLLSLFSKAAVWPKGATGRVESASVAGPCLLPIAWLLALRGALHSCRHVLTGLLPIVRHSSTEGIRFAEQALTRQRAPTCGLSQGSVSKSLGAQT